LEADDAMTSVVLVDTREQAPLNITAFPTERVGLPCGDYGIAGFSDWNNPAFIVERKTLNDLVGCLTNERDRFMREVEKLRQFRFHALVIEALEAEISFHHYRSDATPQSILQTLAALQVRAGLHVLWCADPERAARCVERLVRQFVRGIEKDYRLIGQASDGLLAASLAP
jgi:ERCC4-type nuclease